MSGTTAASRKGALRRALRERRAALEEATRRAWSSALCHHLVHHRVWRAAHSVAAFVGVRSEPDTTAILERAWAEGKVLLLPRVVSLDPPRLAWIRCVEIGQLEAGTFGLLEPRARPEWPPRPSLDGVDLVLVPGLGFGSDGARIGFGKGHYDHALAALRGFDVPVRMGVGFVPFLDPPEGPIPMEPFDVPMHWVATDRGVVRCADIATPTR